MADLDDLLWVSKENNTVSVIVYLYTDSTFSKIYAIERQSDPKYLELGLEEHQIESRWSIPNRAEMESHRQDSATYNFQNGSLMVNEFMLSDCVISHHLEALLFDGRDVPLERDAERVLEPSSLARLKLLHTGVYDTLYAKYCVEACL